MICWRFKDRDRIGLDLMNPSSIDHVPVFHHQTEELYEHYLFKNQIGEGSFSKVFKAIDIKTGNWVAIKRLNLNNNENDIRHEILILRQLQHNKYVIQLVGYDQWNFVFELMDYSLSWYLQSHMIQNRFISQHDIMVMMYHLLSAISSAHRRKIVHRDIKPQNILLSVEQKCVKLADFGSAIDLKLNCTCNICKMTYIQTRWYRAPEILLGVTQCCPSMDIWSLGCIFAELYTISPLFRGTNAHHQLDEIFKLRGTPWSKYSPVLMYYPNWDDYKKVSQTYPIISLKSVIVNAPNEAIDLILKMLSLDPTMRITAQEALRHSFFTPIWTDHEEEEDLVPVSVLPTITVPEPMAIDKD